MAAITERLNAAGYRTARGKAFTRSTLYRLPAGEVAKDFRLSRGADSA